MLLPVAPLAAELERVAKLKGWERHANGTAGFAYERLARMAGVTPRLLYAIRNDERTFVQLDTADHLAHALGIPLATIYRGYR